MESAKAGNAIKPSPRQHPKSSTTLRIYLLLAYASVGEPFEPVANLITEISPTLAVAEKPQDEVTHKRQLNSCNIAAVRRLPLAQ